MWRVCPLVFPFEGDALVGARDQAAVGDGNAVGLTAEIGEHRLGSGEGALGIDHPIDVAQRAEIIGEVSGIGKMAMSAEELQVSGLMGGDELLQKHPAEQL